MGNCCQVKDAIDHWIYVKTGDRKGAGTDANVRIVLVDEHGTRTDEIKLDCFFRNDFERGSDDVFQAPPLGPNFGDVTEIELWRDNAGISPDWFCEVVVVNDRRSQRSFYFPIQRWLKPQQRYKIPVFDTSLPQNDPTGLQRRHELEEKRAVYQYEQKAPGMPVQVKNVPADELFSDEYKWDIVSSKSKLIAASMLTSTSGSWSGLSDLTRIYSKTFPPPAGISQWSNDVCFGAQRLKGCNPNEIRLCTSLPENMGITAEMLRPFLEGWSLKQIINAKRLFYIDMKILDGLPTNQNAMICAPIGLFVINGDGQLLPIAIQLKQHITPDNPVFLPNDPPFTWLLAKMWFNNADSYLHQMRHLGLTHLLMEGVCVSMHRNLSVSHPLHKLLAPHFIFLIAINARGLEKLIQPGGWVDQCMGTGCVGLIELIRRGVSSWRIDVNGILRKELESRGVADPKVLPNYPYRDDAMLVYDAIHTYVKRIVSHYYDNVVKIREDWELQNWGKELTMPREQGGVGIQGMPSGGMFESTDDIVLVCVAFIFTCSVQHAAVGFNQYEEYGFPPNYPAFLNGHPPTDRLARLEEDIVALLPSKSRTLDTMVISRLLSSKNTKSLADWEFQYQYEPVALAAEKQFRQDLHHISQEIGERNESRSAIYKYPYLSPDIVPNAISI